MTQLARKSDPETSHIAADEIVESGKYENQKAQVYNALKIANAMGELPTSAELAWASGLDRYLVARRLPDLEKQGLVAKDSFEVNGNAVHMKRQCFITGKTACVWKIK